MRKFEFDDVVVLRRDHPSLDLKAGDTGTVVAGYDMDPPAYEVTFRDQKGIVFDTLMEEHELDFPPNAT